jgi:hypothetical protein
LPETASIRHIRAFSVPQTCPTDEKMLSTISLFVSPAVFALIATFVYFLDIKHLLLYFLSTTGGAFFTVRAFGGSQDVGVVAYTLRLSQICSSFFTFLALTSIIYSGRSLLVDRLHKFIDGCRRLRFD